MTPICFIRGCTKPVVAVDRCQKHYQRWHNSGEDFEFTETSCLDCKTPFLPKTRRHKYCSVICTKRSEARRRLGIQAPEAVRSCWWCEAEFESPDGRRLYCGDECGRIGSLLYNIQRKYGMSKEEYRAVYRRQAGLCAICHQPERTDRNTLLAVDHDHVTGRFRGLLCSQCNRAIGLLGDDPVVIGAALEYVKAGHEQRRDVVAYVYCDSDGSEFMMHPSNVTVVLRDGAA